MQPSEKIVLMANQIARNMMARGEEKAVAEMADHIQKFWDPRMRATAAKVLAGGGKDLVPLAKAALELAVSDEKRKAG